MDKHAEQRARLSNIIKTMRMGILMPPVVGGSLGLGDEPCPDCNEKMLSVRWWKAVVGDADKDHPLAVYCRAKGCAFVQMEERN